MPETFIDKRRRFIRELLESYGENGNLDEKAEKWVRLWIDKRLRQLDIEMFLAATYGATSQEIAELFGYSNAGMARTALSTAAKKAELPPFPASSRD